MSEARPYTPEQPSITCPQCGMVSYNPGDIENRYCGNCHQYHSDMERLVGTGFTCPQCKQPTLVRSIFGNICATCFYEPAD